MSSPSNSKCPIPIIVEIGASLFAIFNMIVAISTIAYSILLCVVSIVKLPVLSNCLVPIIYKGPGYVDLEDFGTSETFDDGMRFFYDSLVPPLMLTSGKLLLVFSILLILGLRKKRYEYVKAFFMYGIIITPICLIYSVIGIYLASNYGIRFMMPIIEYMFLNVFFLGGLVLVYKTFKKFQKGAEKREENELMNKS